MKSIKILSYCSLSSSPFPCWVSFINRFNRRSYGIGPTYIAPGAIDGKRTVEGEGREAKAGKERELTGSGL